MTGSEVAQIITSIATLIGVMGSMLISMRNGKKMDETKERISETKKKIEEVHQATNGMKDELVASTAKAAQAEGLAKGLVAGRALQIAENHAAATGTYQGLVEVAQAIKEK